MLSKLTKGNKVVATAASVALVCFFLPWVLVSCGGQPVASISGWQLAAGGSINTGWSSQPIPGSPVLFLVLLAALASLASVYLVYKGQLKLRTAALTALASGAVALLTLLARFSGAQSETGSMGVSAQLEVGFWGTVLAHVAIVAGGLLDLKAAQSGEALGTGDTPPAA